MFMTLKNLKNIALTLFIPMLTNLSHSRAPFLNTRIQECQETISRLTTAYRGIRYAIVYIRLNSEKKGPLLLNKSTSINDYRLH